MAPPVVTPALQNAYAVFQVAVNEFNRPNEDVVTLCACSKIRGAMEEFLRSFLKSKHVLFSEKNSAEDLLKLCIAVDSKFRSVDLSYFVCTNEEKGKNPSHCYSVENMKDCFAQTEKVKNMVLAGLNLSEKNFESNLERA